MAVFANILGDKEESWYLRRTAVKHLKSLRHLRDVYQSESYIRALEVAAGDEDEGLARIARETLKEIKARSADDVPPTHPEPDIDRN
jgi:transcription termination factor Rho